jgi:23S rRNA (adenine2030-N6)-methyltransferase
VIAVVARCYARREHLAIDSVLRAELSSSVLSYQHAYHAGNHADVLKHVVLLSMLAQLTVKPAPLRYIETHAGAGIYDLSSALAQKNREYESGIGQVFTEGAAPPAVARLIDLVVRCNGAGKKLTRYPGSPWLARTMLRDGDSAFLFELHPAEQRTLAKHIGADARVNVLHENGLTGAIGLVPPPTRRALVLVDPSYEVETEQAAVLDALAKMHRRFATGVYAIWHPIVERRAAQRFERAALATGIAPIDRYELSVAPDARGGGLTGSVMLVINPPWKLREELAAALPWLARTLGVDGRGTYRIEH